MNHTQDGSTRASKPKVDLRELLRETSELPKRIEAGMIARPLATAAAIAGVAFVVGTIAGSRVARSIIGAATPVIARRLLEGPLGDDLAGYMKSIFHTVPRSDAS